MSLSGHEQDVLSVTFSVDGKYLATGSGDTLVRIWDVKGGKLLHVLEGHSAEVGGLAFSPDGKHLGTVRPAEVPANCAFGGRAMTGRVRMTIAAGAVVYRERSFAIGAVPA